MSTAVAKNLMAEMKLLGMLGAFDKILADTTRDKTSYSEFLDALLQAECDYRQERKTGYRIKAAKFTLRKILHSLHSRTLLRTLTVKLRGHTMWPEKRRERTISRALATRQITPHGPLQRLLEARHCLQSKY